MDDLEGEIILDDIEDLQEEISNDVFTPDEELLFQEIDTGELIEENNPIVSDVDNYINSVENTDFGDNGTISELYNEIRDIQNNMESEMIEGDSKTIDNDILESLQISQQNIKTGFDNLSLLGTVNVGITAFGIGAIIIYCYIGRFR